MYAIIHCGCTECWVWEYLEGMNPGQMSVTKACPGCGIIGEPVGTTEGKR